MIKITLLFAAVICMAAACQGGSTSHAGPEQDRDGSNPSATALPDAAPVDQAADDSDAGEGDGDGDGNGNGNREGGSGGSGGEDLVITDANADADGSSATAERADSASPDGTDAAPTVEGGPETVDSAGGGDSGASLRTPTYPGAYAELIAPTLQVADFFVAPDEQSIATTPLQVTSSGTCVSEYISLLHHDGTQFQVVAKPFSGVQYSTVFFTDDSRYLTFVQSNGCPYRNDLVSMKVDGTSLIARSPLTFGSDWQDLVGLFGDTAVTINWRYPNSRREPDGWAVVDFSSTASTRGFAWASGVPALDPTGKVATWFDSGMLLLGGLDQKNPVTLAASSTQVCDNVVWAPDGSTLVFTRTSAAECNNAFRAVTIAGRDGQSVHELGSLTAQNSTQLVYAPDSHKVAWTDTSATGQHLVGVHALGADPPITIGGFPAIDAQAWSRARLSFTSGGDRLVVNLDDDLYTASVALGAAGTFARIAPPEGTFAADGRHYAFQTGQESFVSPSLASEGAATVVAVGSDFEPVLPTADGIARLAVSENRSADSSDLVLIDYDGGNRQLLPGRVPIGAAFDRSSFYQRSPRAARVQWLGGVVVYPGVPRYSPNGKVFDLFAASADGKTTGVIAPDVIAYSWVAKSPTSLFFIRQMPTSSPQLWRVRMP